MYSEEKRLEIVNKVCDLLIEGKSLRKICKDKDMPNIVTIIRWMNAEDDIANTIARAREFQADVLYDDIQVVTDKIESGELDPQAAKVIIWAKQWSASKMKPKKYGDRTKVVTDDGQGGDAPITAIQWNPVDGIKD